MYEYKIQQLEKMLEYEQAQPEQNKYGAHVTHWSGCAKSINIDEGALTALIQYYKGQGVSR